MRFKSTYWFSLSLLLFFIHPLFANQVLSPNPTVTNPFVEVAPENVVAKDLPNNSGKVLQVSWNFPDTLPIMPRTIKIYRYEHDTISKHIADVTPNVKSFLDTSVMNGIPYRYSVQAEYPTGIVGGLISEPAIAKAEWFDRSKINLFVIALILVSFILGYIFYSEKGQRLFIRKIAGIQAIEEAVGRATEMGKPVLFVPGTQDMDNVQTIAGLTILSSVAKMTAKYETKLDVPVSRSITMSTGRETVHEAYLAAGRPDLYSDDIVHYITDEQFGFVAAIDGIMVRDRPAACIYMGAFFAESLILAETGNGIGAIQIAGTAMPTQLPFFVAACDYTLIGEELFAASAYLSGDKRSIASLKGQDMGKAFAIVLIAVTALFSTLSVITGNEFFTNISTFLLNLTISK
ncbi:MAG: hypothetical protein N2450_05615 [bacterium]|nr:hypothetical protein [bacterium]